MQFKNKELVKRDGGFFLFWNKIVHPVKTMTKATKLSPAPLVIGSTSVKLSNPGELNMEFSTLISIYGKNCSHLSSGLQIASESYIHNIISQQSFVNEVNIKIEGKTSVVPLQTCIEGVS